MECWWDGSTRYWYLLWAAVALWSAEGTELSSVEVIALDKAFPSGCMGCAGKVAAGAGSWAQRATAHAEVVRGVWSSPSVECAFRFSMAVATRVTMRADNKIRSPRCVRVRPKTNPSLPAEYASIRCSTRAGSPDQPSRRAMCVRQRAFRSSSDGSLYELSALRRLHLSGGPSPFSFLKDAPSHPLPPPHPFHSIVFGGGSGV